MNTLAITIGITLFLILVIFMACSVYNIRKNAKLKSFYKKTVVGRVRNIICFGN